MYTCGPHAYHNTHPYTGKKKTLIKKKLIRKKKPVVVEVKGIALASSDAICELEWEAPLDRWRVLPQPSCMKGFHHFFLYLFLVLTFHQFFPFITPCPGTMDPKGFHYHAFP